MSLTNLFVRGSNKNKGGVELFQISQKEKLFHLLYDNQVLLGIISQCACGPPSWTLQKRHFFPLQFGKKNNIFGHSIEKRVC